MKIPLFRSIRWRLQIWHGSILLIVLTGLGLTAHQFQWAKEVRRLDQELDQKAEAVARTLRNPRADSRVPSSGFGSETGVYFILWRRDGQRLDESPNSPADLPLPKRPPPTRSQRESRTRAGFREVVRFTPPGECVLVGQSLDSLRAELSELAIWLSAAGGAILALGLLGGAWMSARAMRPIEEISAAASRIAGGHLSERIDVADTRSELGQLAAVLNSTFARLEASFNRQQQFTSDASHELRTPITVILNQTQSALAKERPIEDYKESLAACERAAQRMRRLTESLLALARMDGPSEDQRREECDLAKIAGECLELAKSLATEKRIQMTADLQTATCIGDPERLAQVITNLLTNAIDHNSHGGAARLETRTEAGHAVVSVSDTGPGIPEEHLPKIFDRFYRVDASRSAIRGNAGLGLAISKAIVDGHGGRLEVANRAEGGAVFRVYLGHSI
jgi:two-component system OmpR family sensor kinase